MFRGTNIPEYSMRHLLSNRSGTKGEQNGRGIIVVAGIILLVGGCFSLEILWFLRGAAAAPGLVVENRREINPNKRGPDKTDLYMVVEFADSAGGKHRIETKCASEEDAVKGTAYTVYYLPRNVAKARIGGLYLWWVPSGCLCFAAFLGSAGLFLIFLARFLVWIGVPMRPATGPKRIW